MSMIGWIILGSVLVLGMVVIAWSIHLLVNIRSVY